MSHTACWHIGGTLPKRGKSVSGILCKGRATREEPWGKGELPGELSFLKCLCIRTLGRFVETDNWAPPPELVIQ